MYGNLFYLLQSEPKYVAALCKPIIGNNDKKQSLTTLAENEDFLQTIMVDIDFILVYNLW